jgi:hypothetical protein
MLFGTTQGEDAMLQQLLKVTQACARARAALARRAREH